MTNESDQIPWDEIKDALFSGRKIEAIKVYREATGQGLKESKEFIDDLEARMRKEFPDHFKAAGGKGCPGVLLFVAGGAVMSGLLAVALFFY